MFYINVKIISIEFGSLKKIVQDGVHLLAIIIIQPICVQFLWLWLHAERLNGPYGITIHVSGEKN